MKPLVNASKKRHTIRAGSLKILKKSKKQIEF